LTTLIVPSDLAASRLQSEIRDFLMVGGLLPNVGETLNSLVFFGLPEYHLTEIC